MTTLFFAGRTACDICLISSRRLSWRKCSFVFLILILKPKTTEDESSMTRCSLSMHTTSPLMDVCMLQQVCCKCFLMQSPDHHHLLHQHHHQMWKNYTNGMSANVLHIRSSDVCPMRKCFMWTHAFVPY